MVVAKGQILRHRPVATTNRAGATGINIFQKTNNPIDGKNSKEVKILTPINQNSV